MQQAVLGGGAEFSIKRLPPETFLEPERRVQNSHFCVGPKTLGCIDSRWWLLSGLGVTGEELVGGNVGGGGGEAEPAPQSRLGGGSSGGSAHPHPTSASQVGEACGASGPSWFWALASLPPAEGSISSVTFCDPWPALLRCHRSPPLPLGGHIPGIGGPLGADCLPLLSPSGSPPVWLRVAQGAAGSRRELGDWPYGGGSPAVRTLQRGCLARQLPPKAVLPHHKLNSTPPFICLVHFLLCSSSGELRGQHEWLSISPSQQPCEVGQAERR